MFEVALGVLLFTALMTGLAAAVLAARALLLPRQEVLVRVNDGKPTPRAVRHETSGRPRRTRGSGFPPRAAALARAGCAV